MKEQEKSRKRNSVAQEQENLCYEKIGKEPEKKRSRRAGKEALLEQETVFRLKAFLQYM